MTSSYFYRWHYQNSIAPSEAECPKRGAQASEFLHFIPVSSPKVLYTVSKANIFFNFVYRRGRLKLLSLIRKSSLSRFSWEQVSPSEDFPFIPFLVDLFSLLTPVTLVVRTIKEKMNLPKRDTDRN